MIADWILVILGRTPEAYPQGDDKWAAILVDVTEFIVPILMLLLFLSPIFIIKLRKKKFTALNVTLAIIIGAMLAYGVWLLNEWSYGYGQGVIFRAIYD